MAEQHPRLNLALIAAPRYVLVVLLTGIVLAGTYRGALALDDPDESVPAAVRDALDEAFADFPHGDLSFGGVADGTWTRLYVFPPLSKRNTIRRALHSRQGAEEVHAPGSDGEHSLLVFADRERILGSTLVDRRYVELSCIVATRRWRPWVSIVRAGRSLRVIRTERREPPLLAATANDREAVQRCVRRLPRLADR